MNKIMKDIYTRLTKDNKYGVSYFIERDEQFEFQIAICNNQRRIGAWYVRWMTDFFGKYVNDERRAK